MSTIKQEVDNLTATVATISAAVISIQTSLAAGSAGAGTPVDFTPITDQLTAIATTIATLQTAVSDIQAQLETPAAAAAAPAAGAAS